MGEVIGLIFGRCGCGYRVDLGGSEGVAIGLSGWRWGCGYRVDLGGGGGVSIGLILVEVGVWL